MSCVDISLVTGNCWCWVASNHSRWSSVRSVSWPRPQLHNTAAGDSSADQLRSCGCLRLRPRPALWRMSTAAVTSNPGLATLGTHYQLIHSLVTCMLLPLQNFEAVLYFYRNGNCQNVFLSTKINLFLMAKLNAPINCVYYVSSSAC